MRGWPSLMARARTWSAAELGVLAVAMALTGLNSIAVPLVGLGRWQRLIIRLTPDREPARQPARQAEVIGRTTRVMTAAHRRRLLPGSCLARSLALQTILAASGVAGDLRVGVRRGPDGVQAHAWVECQGRRIDLDSEDRFVPFEQPLGPSPRR